MLGELALQSGLPRGDDGELGGAVGCSDNNRR